MKRTSEIIEQAALAARAQGIGTREIATQLGVGVRTVHEMVRRHGDLPEATQDVQGAYIAAGFKYMWIESLDHFRRQAERGELTAQDRKNLALTAAISIDKLAMVQGWPTQVIAHLHEHRHKLGEVGDKLAAVARVLSTDTPQGYTS